MIKTRVRIWHDDGKEVDLTNRLASEIRVRGDIDSADYSCSMTFSNGLDAIGRNESLCPLDMLSAFNRDLANNYRPLLSNNHRVLVEIDEGAGWQVFFEGLAGSSLRSTVVNTKRNTVSFSPDGVLMVYKETTRLSPVTYKNRDLASSLLRSILLDSGFVGRKSHVVIQDNPNMQVAEYTTPVGSTWEALTVLVARTGFVLAARPFPAGTPYNDGTGASTPADGFYMTLYDCLRTKTLPDHVHLEEGTRRRVKHSIDDVRTWIQVAFQNEEGAQVMTPPIYNEDSRLKFGIPRGDGERLHRKMRLVEGNNSPIRTMEGAIKYRNNALHDLDTPTPDATVDLDRLFFAPQLHDLVEFHFADYSLLIGITSIEREVGPGVPLGTSTFSGTVEKVIGMRHYWLGQELTEAEVAHRRRQFLDGGLERLPKPVILHARHYTVQGGDGTTHSAVALQWKRVEAWWYGHTGVYVSIGDNQSYGQESMLSVRGSFAVITPLPTGQAIYIKLRHYPAGTMTPQGRR